MTVSSTETELLSKQASIQAEDGRYRAELSRVQNEAVELEKEEQKYWGSIAAFEKQLIESEEEACMVKSELDRVEKEYQRLISINVVSDVFKISCPERVAAINGFRLGKLQSEDVGTLLINL